MKKLVVPAELPEKMIMPSDELSYDPLIALVVNYIPICLEKL